MNISTSYYSARGGRKQNEDAVSLLESCDTVLVVAADGLGGHECGELASGLAVKTMNAALSHTVVSASGLLSAVAKANTAILADSRSSSMKTTLAALWLDKNDALAATVGDTRIYQFRRGSILFQSRDHSLAQAAVAAGELHPEDIRSSGERHRLFRALGADDEVKADLAALRVEHGDAFLLCTDGFWGKILETEMVWDLAETDDADQWLRRMRRRVEERGALTGDNHTAAALRIR